MAIFSDVQAWLLIALLAIGAFAYVVVGFVITRAAMRRCRTVAGRNAVALTGALLFLLIPTWDILPNRLAFDRQCEREAGVRIHRAVDGVEGFVIGALVWEGMLQDSPYRWFEGRGREGGRVRVERGADGAVTVTPIREFSARYGLEYSDIVMPLAITVYRVVVVDRQTGEVLGTRGSVYTSGGWFRHFLGSPNNQCFGATDPYRRFVYDTLRPLGYRQDMTIPNSF